MQSSALPRNGVARRAAATAVVIDRPGVPAHHGPVATTTEGQTRTRALSQGRCSITLGGTGGRERTHLACPAETGPRVTRVSGRYNRRRRL